MKQPLLEPFLRRLRIRRVLPVILQSPGCILLDIGCGFNHQFLSEIEPHLAEGHGIDFKVPETSQGRIFTRRATLDEQLPFPDGKFDLVTLLAVLEHLAKPDSIVREIHRVLKPGGRLVMTVPTTMAAPVLELLSYRLKLVSEAEIRDHKQYFNRRSLEDLFRRTGFLIDRHEYFQLRMNNFCIARKPGSPAS